MTDTNTADNNDEHTQRPLKTDWCLFFVPRDSMYGHVDTLAAEAKAGIEEAGCECVMVRCPETLSPEVLEKM